MKRILLLTAVLSTLATVTTVGAPYEKPMGIHAVYAGHGDMDDTAYGFGLQITGYETERASVELAWSYFQDEEKTSFVKVENDVHVIALTARYQAPFLKIIGPYAGIGASYHMFDSSTTARQPDAVGVKISLDDDFGWHACAGLQYELMDKMVLFGEFRRNNMSTTGKYRESGSWDRFTTDFDYNMVRAGVNFWF